MKKNRLRCFCFVLPQQPQLFLQCFFKILIPHVFFILVPFHFICYIKVKQEFGFTLWISAAPNREVMFINFWQVSVFPFPNPHLELTGTSKEAVIYPTCKTLSHLWHVMEFIDKFVAYSFKPFIHKKQTGHFLVSIFISFWLKSCSCVNNLWL